MPPAHMKEGMRSCWPASGDGAAERGQPGGEHPRLGGAQRDADPGGNTWNVLPESVELEGTLRTHSSEVQQRVKARVSEIAAGFASAFGAQIDVFWYAGPTALVNDARWADFASEVAAQAGYRTHHADLHLGGEDFAVYLQHIPGAFVSIGSASEYGLHHPAFNPDERLIAPVAHYFARLAEEALQHI